jgi:tetratricopeptide (TPR) repeat protein
MDSKHRHELMHNELADWIGKLPELARTYRNQIIGVALVIIGLISWPILNRWREDSDFVAKAQVTEQIDAVEMGKYMAMNAYSAKPDPNTSAVNSLLVAANNLADEAKKAPTADLAALALVKCGQALRTDLLLKKELISQDIVQSQIKQAQDAYQEAFNKATQPSIKAMAQLGLGLCSEELGQLEQAKDFYQKIVDNPAYLETPLIAMAKKRIADMDDNNVKYTFVDAPKPTPAAVNPQIELTPAPAKPVAEPVAAPAVEKAPQEPNTQTK